MKILVTGGAGYVGSHAVRELLKNGYEVVVYDNLSRGFQESLSKDVKFVHGDLNNPELLEHVFNSNKFDAVIDFAGHLEVEESMRNPEKFYLNNVISLLNLLKSMHTHNVKTIVYSSSASVYGQPKEIPVSEAHINDTNNVYGETKAIAERMLKFFDNIYGIKSISLRYFNASGADSDGEIGEAHNPETHLIPIVFNTALGKRRHISIYGTDYPTKDGTAVRDYIHVNDLSQVHILAMERLISEGKSNIFNVGTGKGYSVNEILETARKITGCEIPSIIGSRRFGDPAELVAGVNKIKGELGWEPRYSDLKTIMETSWNWHKNHPNGYEKQSS
ncbi:UDP-glucose 4-epimerase GalE [Candidatus Pacearchaeota archaeon]|nr:UDP-glucose 4-epimerase GalE [Candidatus Pacearchaeota archaeon]